MNKWISIAVALVLLPLVSQAATLRGVPIQEIVPAADGRPELILNGAAVRQKYLLVDIYVGALYLERAEHTSAEILSDPGYKRMTFHLLRNVRGRIIAQAIYEGMRLNITKEEAESMAPQIEQFINIFDMKITEGETAILDYIPGKGTRVEVAGKEKGIVPGKKLYDAILAIWIGDNPVAEAFKDGILGVEQQAMNTDTHTPSASSRRSR